MSQVDNEISDNIYAKQGIAMWLNNKPKEAEEFFKKRLNSTQVLAGYAFTLCLNGAISYELDKINEAQSTLQELGNLCSYEYGFLKSVKAHLFGKPESKKPLQTILEEQIILADSQLCSAILTFLTNDISGLMKGSWLLRKAWKVYQQTYNQIFGLYKQININESVTNINAPIDLNGEHSSSFNFFNSNSPVIISNLNCTGKTSIATNLPKAQSTYEFYDENIYDNNNLYKVNTITEEVVLNISNNLITSTTSTNDIETVTRPSNITNNSNNSIPEYTSLASVKTSDRIKRSISLLPVLSSYENNTLRELETNSNNYISPQDIKRLMGAVSFGYGMFQLSISMLPPNLLKFISFFGFEGNRNIGISCLMYARNCDDMRAPLATLALLWYFTIGTQFIIIDSSTLKEDISAATKLLSESQSEFSESALYLFYKGRLDRVKCNITEAISSYHTAYEVSAQKEIQLLCLHEVGWCYLIQLDYKNALVHFQELRLRSLFSKNFYTYLTTICQGAIGNFPTLIKLRKEIVNMLSKSGNKEAQIAKYIINRIDKIPETRSQENMFNTLYWRYLLYEMLYMWNTLTSCNPDSIQQIIEDCSTDTSELNEPTKGIAKLLLASCESIKCNYDNAIEAYRECINMTKNNLNKNDEHIVAFASYELAMLLLKHKNELKSEAKDLLLYAQTLKNYDFENRLTVRIHSVLKNL